MRTADVGSFKVKAGNSINSGVGRARVGNLDRGLLAIHEPAERGRGRIKVSRVVDRADPQAMSAICEAGQGERARAASKSRKVDVALETSHARHARVAAAKAKGRGGGGSRTARCGRQ